MSLYDAAKDAVKLAQKADNIELVQKIFDVQKEALDMQEKMQRKIEEVSELKHKLQQLNNELELRGSYVLKMGVYWDVQDNEYNQPFCPTCYSKSKIVPLQKNFAGKEKSQTPWRCSDKICGTNANPWDYKSLPRTQVRY